MRDFVLSQIFGSFDKILEKKKKKNQNSHLEILLSVFGRFLLNFGIFLVHFRSP